MTESAQPPFAIVEQSELMDRLEAIDPDWTSHFASVESAEAFYARQLRGTAVLSVCKTVAAITTHLREIGPKGYCYNGGADTLTLCGFAAAWDLMQAVDLQNVRCRECRGIYRTRHLGESQEHNGNG